MREWRINNFIEEYREKGGSFVWFQDSVTVDGFTDPSSSDRFVLVGCQYFGRIRIKFLKNKKSAFWWDVSESYFLFLEGWIRIWLFLLRVGNESVFFRFRIQSIFKWIRKFGCDLIYLFLKTWKTYFYLKCIKGSITTQLRIWYYYRMILFISPL